MPLRAVVFGLEGVFFQEAGEWLSPEIETELRSLFQFLRENDVKPMILTNRSWKFTDEEGKDRPIDEYLARFGNYVLYETVKQGLPRKGTKEIVSRIRADHKLKVGELAYVGTTEEDMQTAVNSKLLLLNATWIRQDVPYGFTFKRPAEVKAFIELFGLKAHPWFFVVDKPVVLRSMAPFSTRFSEYERYSRAARRAAKELSPERWFFLRSLMASVYLSGLEFDLIACVPGHEKGFGNPAMDDALHIVAKTFKAKYIPDLVVRHSSAPKSQEVRMAGGSPLPLDQLNTIHLTELPIKKQTGERYKKPIALKERTVLLIDDFCTEGHSLEAARLFLEKAGAKVLLVPWLKTVNRGYHVLGVTRNFDPFEPQTFKKSETKQVRVLDYNKHIVDAGAPKELTAAFIQYLRSLRASA